MLNARSLTRMHRHHQNASSGPPPPPSSAPMEEQHQALHAPSFPPFHGFQPPQHPLILAGHPPLAGQYPNGPGLAMSLPHYTQPYGAPYYPPAYPREFISGPGQLQPWDHAYFPSHLVPPVPHPVATHPGPDNDVCLPISATGAPAEGTRARGKRATQATTPTTQRARAYLNTWLGEGGK